MMSKWFCLLFRWSWPILAPCRLSSTSWSSWYCFASHWIFHQLPFNEWSNRVESPASDSTRMCPAPLRSGNVSCRTNRNEVRFAPESRRSPLSGACRNSVRFVQGSLLRAKCISRSSRGISCLSDNPRECGNYQSILFCNADMDVLSAAVATVDDEFHQWPGLVHDDDVRVAAGGGSPHVPRVTRGTGSAGQSFEPQICSFNAIINCKVKSVDGEGFLPSGLFVR